MRGSLLRSMSCIPGTRDSVGSATSANLVADKLVEGKSTILHQISRSNREAEYRLREIGSQVKIGKKVKIVTSGKIGIKELLCSILIKGKVGEIGKRRGHLNRNRVYCLALCLVAH